jgi:hypothetical protein
MAIFEPPPASHLRLLVERVCLLPSRVLGLTEICIKNQNKTKKIKTKKTFFGDAT